jgi:hypothetical protein
MMALTPGMMRGGNGWSGGRKPEAVDDGVDFVE